MIAFKLSDPFAGYFDLLLIAEREDQECREHSEQAQYYQPPDVPDQRKADDDSKERGDEADGTALGHFDCPVSARRHLVGVLLLAPPGVDRRDIWQDGVIPRRWRRGRRPFQRAAIPRIAGQVAKLLTCPDRH